MAYEQQRVYRERIAILYYYNTIFKKKKFRFNENKSSATLFNDLNRTKCMN